MCMAYLVIVERGQQTCFPEESELLLLGFPFGDHVSLALTTDVSAGEFLVLVGDRATEAPFAILAAYTLDEENRPYQIFGTEDILLNGAVAMDCTQPYLCVLEWFKEIVEEVFEYFSLEEMECNREALCSWEAKLRENLLMSARTWVQCRRQALCSIRQAPFPPQFREMGITAIENMEQTRASVSCVRRVNWENYPHIKEVRAKCRKSAPGLS